MKKTRLPIIQQHLAERRLDCVVILRKAKLKTEKKLLEKFDLKSKEMLLIGGATRDIEEPRHYRSELNFDLARASDFCKF